MMKEKERPRHFVIRDKKRDNYDAPTVRRRTSYIEHDRDEEEAAEEKTHARGRTREREREEEEQQPQPRKQRKRMTLREREMDEAEEDRSLRRARMRKRIKEEPEPDYEELEAEDGNESSKAPKIVRVFAWIALMIILFACGYLATNYFFSWSDKKGGERIGSVYGTGAEVEEHEKREAAQVPTSSDAAYTIYIPGDNGYEERAVEIAGSQTVEEDVSKVMSMYVDSLKETKAFDTNVAIGDIFRSGDWLYLDMNDAFQKSLKTMGKEKAQKVLGGFVRAARKNFPPAKKVKFYVNSREIKDKNPVDLSEPWEKTD